MSQEISGATSLKVIVVGGGPGGYVAAIRGAQLGMSVTLVEKADLGGVCLNWGCIPTKALLASAHALEVIESAASHGITMQAPPVVDYPAVVARSRKVAERLSKGVGMLMKKNRIEVVQGSARLTGPTSVAITSPDGSERMLQADRVVLATGARANDFPGLRIDGKRVIGSREALVLDHVPKTMAIVGAGSIGVEFAHHFRQFGCDVTLFEALPSLLPSADDDVSRELERAFRKRKIRVFTDTRIEALETSESSVAVTYSRKGQSERIDVEYVLVAVGVRPNVEGLGLEALGVETKRGGYVQVDEFCRTNVAGLYAIGDLAGAPCLAHKASAEGILVMEHLAGEACEPIDYGNIAACTYCRPQVASVGLTEGQVREMGLGYKVGRFHFRASGKAIAMDETEGFVKVIVGEEYGELLGCHIIGSEATELIAELALARHTECTWREVLKTIHPHPTLSEAVMEAVGDAVGECINA